MPKSYSALCRVHLPRLIHKKIELQKATEIVDFLAGHKLNFDQDDYLDLVSDLVAKYEDEQIEIPAAIRRGKKAAEAGRTLAHDKVKKLVLKSVEILAGDYAKRECGLTATQMKGVAKKLHAKAKKARRAGRSL